MAIGPGQILQCTVCNESTKILALHIQYNRCTKILIQLATACSFSMFPVIATATPKGRGRDLNQVSFRDLEEGFPRGPYTRPIFGGGGGYRHKSLGRTGKNLYSFLSTPSSRQGLLF